MKMNHLSFIFSLLLATTHAATFVVKNNCSYTVWGAAFPGGGQQLNQGDTWIFNVADGTPAGRVWARTGCTSTGPNGLNCNTGDCRGVLQCTAYGRNPNTLAEYTLNYRNNNVDFFDISIVAGFNVPISFMPTSNGCTVGTSCSADITSQCPGPLRVNGGCMDPCSVFNQAQYCCNSGQCNPTQYSQFFKNLCPQAYSYPMDDASSNFICPGGTNYMVTFCP